MIVFFCYYEVTEVARWDHFKVVTELFFSFLFVKEQVDACSKWHTGMSTEVQSYKVQKGQFLKNQNFLNSLVSGANYWLLTQVNSRNFGLFKVST